MREITSARIAELTHGRLVGGATGMEVVHGKATVDSRQVDPGDLFVAFAGHRHDAHAFVESTRAAGSPLALVTRDVGFPAVLVDDALEAVSALAKAELEAARECPNGPIVIALTGSSGKTSTKDLLASILSPVGPTIAPVGSRNNELGLPLTILELRDDTRFLVLEMGARGLGHISALTTIARPDIALVLNVGSAHIGEFGSIDTIERAKAELVASIDDSGIAALNADDPRVARMDAVSAGQVLRWGYGPGPGLHTSVSDVELDEWARPTLTLTQGEGEASVRLHLIGEHHASNAAAAACVAAAAGVAFDDIVCGLQAARPRSPGRMQVTDTARAITLINDAYNANPDSMTAALKALAHVGRSRRTIAVLGQMLELGPHASRDHDAMGRLAVRLNISPLIVVGSGARAIHNGACLEGSFGGESTYVETIEEARTVLEKIAEPGDVILLKSSNGAGLAALGESLAHDWTATAEERA